MSQIDLPEDVVQFLVEQIDSVPHLETLLLMWETAPAYWDAEQVTRRVYVPSETAHKVLQDLQRRGFISVDPGNPTQFKYCAEWDTCNYMTNVAQTYRRHLLQVASLIHSKASSAVREFARAFQIRKEP